VSTERTTLTGPETDDTWPNGMPYTVQFPEGDGTAAADLEHPAHLPRVGDTVEYIDHLGDRHRYRVREVVHTLQSADAYRPPVAEADASQQPAAPPAQDAPPELPGGSGQVRAGLPKVILEPMD
jgi:hypothetical protein